MRSSCTRYGPDDWKRSKASKTSATPSPGMSPGTPHGAQAMALLGELSGHMSS
jgi:hypothetical protein